MAAHGHSPQPSPQPSPAGQQPHIVTKALTGTAGSWKFVSNNVIGGGTFATCYKGQDQKTGAVVAIKCVKFAKLSEYPKARTHMKQEIDLTRGLDVRTAPDPLGGVVLALSLSIV
jgi:hypothetical protein